MKVVVVLRHNRPLIPESNEIIASSNPVTTNPENSFTGKIAHMHYAFIDESESPHDSDNPERFGYGVYYIGCLLADEKQISRIQQGFDEIRLSASQRFGVPDDAEFHGRCMFQYEDDWSVMRGKHRASIGIYRQLMRVVAGSGALICIHGVHERQLQARYGKFAHEPHTLALQYCLERVNYHAESHGIEEIEVIADRVSDATVHEGMMRRYKLRGFTEGYVASDLAHIKFPFHWEDSRHSAGLQAIDTVLYILGRAARIDRSHLDHRGDRAVLNTARIVFPSVTATSGISYLLDRKSYYLFPELASGIRRGSPSGQQS